VAVTTSVANPRDDFQANALGTFNALEAARLSEKDPVFIYASTNKVYGGMEAVRIEELGTRWQYADLEHGCAEDQPLDFHSPYGCSKGAGDQYVRDYARIYGLRTVVFRQSCIYGPRQFGVEDQGWLAWMIIAAVTARQITIYGDGKQVRDVLHVDDLEGLRPPRRDRGQGLITWVEESRMWQCGRVRPLLEVCWQLIRGDDDWRRRPARVLCGCARPGTSWGAGSGLKRSGPL
jgi:hypothetical protein